MTGALRLLLAPHRLFFGPVFQRDMRAMGRRRFTYLVRFLFTAGLVALAILVTMGSIEGVAGSGTLLRQQAMQDLAPALTLTVGWFILLTLSFASVVTSAGAISDERHKRTLPALMTTPLTAAEIVFSTLASRFVQLAILTLASAPVLLAARAMGGARAETVVAFLSIALSASLLGSAIALLASVSARRAASAASHALTILFTIYFGPVFVTTLATLGAFSPPPWLTTAIFTTSTPLVAMAVSAEFMGGSGMPAAGTTLWLANTAVNLALALVFALAASATLRRRMRRDAASDGPAPRTTRRARRIARRANAPTPSRPTARAAARTVPDHPLLWRELRQPLHASRGFSIAVALVVLAALILLPVRLGVNEDTTWFLPAVLAVFIALFAAATTPAGTIAGEREARTWDTLLTTRATAGQILLAKAAGALRRQWPVPLALGAYLTAGVALRHLHPLAPVHYLLTLLGPALLLTATGIYLSMLTRSHTRAAALNLGLGIGLYAGLPILLALLSAFQPVANFLEHTAEPFAIVHPLPAVIFGLDGNFSRSPGQFSTGTPYDLGSVDYTRAGFTFALAAVALAHALLAALVLALARLHFNRAAPRAS